VEHFGQNAVSSVSRETFASTHHPHAPVEPNVPRGTLLEFSLKGGVKTRRNVPRGTLLEVDPWKYGVTNS